MPAHHVCPCGCAWFGEPYCWACGARVDRVHAPSLTNASGPAPEAVDHPFTP